MLCRLPYDAGAVSPDVSEGSGGASLAGAFATGVLEIIDILYPDEGAIVSASSAPPWANSEWPMGRLAHKRRCFPLQGSLE